MSSSPVSAAVQIELTELSQMVQFFLNSRWAQRVSEPGISDFMLGNPQEGYVPGYAETLQRWTPPQDKNWFAYKMSEPESQAVVADSLKSRTGIPFEPEDIAMTNGAWGGLAISLRTVVDDSDEVIYVNPPWFFYRTLIRAAGGTPVAVDVQPGTYDLDLTAIADAITPRTRAIMINSPHNPTGRVFSAETLSALAKILQGASERHGRMIYAISDEAYARIVFDGRTCPTLAAYYPATFLIYTLGKTLLTPGERIGYVAMPPEMPDREMLRVGLIMSQVITGFAFPNAVLQHAIEDLDALSIDILHLQAKRDRMVSSLRKQGYDVVNPEGTFYLLVRSPMEDEVQYCDKLAAEDVYVLPGYVFNMPGFFRISLTANDAMIDRALPIFAAAIETSD